MIGLSKEKNKKILKKLSLQGILVGGIILGLGFLQGLIAMLFKTSTGLLTLTFKMSDISIMINSGSFPQLGNLFVDLMERTLTIFSTDGQQALWLVVMCAVGGIIIMILGGYLHEFANSPFLKKGIRKFALQLFIGMFLVSILLSLATSILWFGICIAFLIIYISTLLIVYVLKLFKIIKLEEI